MHVKHLTESSQFTQGDIQFTQLIEFIFGYLPFGQVVEQVLSEFK
jgi:hypothetical protein